jgi:signal transduction histidine kinase
VTASFHDRFGAVFAAGQRIAQARRADEIRAALCDSVRVLLGAERCSVIERSETAGGDPDGSAGGAGGRAPRGIERSEGGGDAPLVAAALRSGRLVVWPTDDATISSSALGSALGSAPGSPPGAGPDVRCALCAPIPVSGRLAVVLYATHSEEAAFGEDARAIAAFLVGLTGAALDGAAARDRTEELDRQAQAQAAELDDLRRQLTGLREQLLHAGRMAAVGTLFAGLTHEINNPLSVITGNVENLRNLAPAGDQIARVIDAIERNATRAARLANALLTFSHRPSAQEDVPPDELIRLVVDLLAADARRREIALRVSVADGLSPLFVIRHEIESALVNITTNALQATPEGGFVELSVSAEPRGAVPGIRFVVRDTGVGIAPEILPQIFDPFFTTKPEGEGTGLGLALARDIASSHGGQLAVESIVGHGTTMSLWLPEQVPPVRPRRTPTG